MRKKVWMWAMARYNVQRVRWSIVCRLDHGDCGSGKSLADFDSILIVDWPIVEAWTLDVKLGLVWPCENGSAPESLTLSAERIKSLPHPPPHVTTVFRPRPRNFPPTQHISDFQIISSFELQDHTSSIQSNLYYQPTSQWLPRRPMRSQRLPLPNLVPPTR